MNRAYFVAALSSLTLSVSLPACLQDYFWQYDNTGLRLAQLRFYAVPTDTN